MSNNNGNNPMPNNNGKNPMPDDMGKYRMLVAAFQNLGLHSNYNYNEREGESSNRNVNSNNNNNNNNPNLNVYNVGHISAASFGAPRFTPPWVTQQGASSSRNSGQPSPSPLGFVSPGIDDMQLDLYMMMTCEERYPEYQEYLENFDTYPTATKESALSIIALTFLDLATNKNGSRALLALFKHSPTFVNLLFRGVYINFFSLMSDKYGYKLIIPTIRAVDRTFKEMLYELTYCYALDLANLDTGCIALNEVIHEIKGSTRDLILELLALNAKSLCFEPYGTHVVQNLLAIQNPHATRVLGERLCGSFIELAKLRQGSYLVEKCLKSDYVRQKVLDEFRGNDQEWRRIANHKFGNFVAQCAFKVMKQNGMRPILRELLEKLRPNFGDMRTGHGKNTLRVIQEEIEEWIDQLPESDELFN